ncbi:glycoside hydrolase family 73 protein [Anaerosphaera multitolerans]|uniref:Exonuclease n=1 Tax=Anaerosphaera multitolerans TaxID=2487351 RepID=A0A437S9L4_9FIRM|nr:glucosaminidase domain-containing protein [Anaerosphaera multitolerans]RVU55682.1 exonuclease [Anaerosphaera multitolerans]
MANRGYKRKKGGGCAFIFFGGLLFLITLFILVLSRDRVNPREEYLENTKYLAMEVSKKYKLFPSVTLAQSALESNFGRSELSTEYKNYFGIKSNSGENAVGLNTSEYIDGEEVTLKENFRRYNTKEESFNDYAKLITEAGRYESVRRAKNYEEAAVALYESGYATDPNYSQKIIDLIEEYNLHELDIETIN